MRLRYTLPALADLNSILDYITKHSPGSAIRVQRRLKAVIELLPDHPRLGSLTNEPTIRRLVVLPYPYLVFYEVGPDEIIVHAIRHAARAPSGNDPQIP